MDYTDHETYPSSCFKPDLQIRILVCNVEYPSFEGYAPEPQSSESDEQVGVGFEKEFGSTMLNCFATRKKVGLEPVPKWYSNFENNQRDASMYFTILKEEFSKNMLPSQ